MSDYYENVDWEKYGRSRADVLDREYNCSRAAFAQCSVSLSFDEFLANAGLFKAEVT